MTLIPAYVPPSYASVENFEANSGFQSMENNAQPPAALIEAVGAIWRLAPPGPSNLFSAPEFLQLREICQRLYPNAGSKDAFTFSLSNALWSLGWPARLAPVNSHLALSANVASARLDEAFRRSQSTRIHLCPLDCADELPTLSFGPNIVRKFSATELEAIADSARLQRNNPTWIFDAERFSEFSWLVVKEVIPLAGKPGERSLPKIHMDFSRDFGAIDPHRERYSTAVEEALFALMLAPWEDWVEYRDLDWRSFRIPWVYAVDDDSFKRPAPPPSPDSLSWEPHFYVDHYGEDIEIERPIFFPLTEYAAKASEWLNDANWAGLVRARQSALFGNLIAHFLVRAFLTDGIDEFLAHITVIEAAVGTSIDYDARGRPRLPNGKNPGATVRIAARLSALLRSSSAGSDFKRLFHTRSAFVHGRTMPPISSRDRLLARQLARKAVVALIKVALANGGPASRDAYLDTLLVEGSAII